ncbi:hypothetical protein QUW15_07805 [Desulfovibrio piger]|nr:hypothetical protein [Desulfovibrio piger]
MSKLPYRFVALLAAASLAAGCSSYQPTKNVWKTTKNFWYTYVSPPAEVDYGEKGDLSPRALALTTCMMGIDVELGKLERLMLNADKPPTREWLDSVFNEYPWINGVAGIRADGEIIGQEPAASLKQIDYIPLLYEDKKQSSRALRADVQASPLGPEVILASPLYDGVTFLGLVAVHFDMRNLMRYATSPEDIVILSPLGLLWPGRFDYASTPLAGVRWDEAVQRSTSGTCSNQAGSFYYMVRYFGNLPLVFAVVESGNFPAGSEEKNQAYYPRQRDKLAPPPLPERKADAFSQPFGAPEGGIPDPAAQVPPASDADVAIPGAPLLQTPEAAPQPPRQVRERQLEGENVQVNRPLRERRVRRLQIDPRALEVAPIPEPGQSFEGPDEGMTRPSPFGPRRSAPSAAPTEEPATEAPEQQPEAQAAPAAPAKEAAAPSETKPAAQPQESAPTAQQEKPAAETPQKTEGGLRLLPGGRPSPFGPH